MKRFVSVLVCLWGLQGFAASSITGSPAPGIRNVYLVGSGGVTANKLVKKDSTGTAVIALTTSDTQADGIAQATVSSGAYATIDELGSKIVCAFDAATTTNDFVIISTTAAASCHDSGTAAYGGASAPTGTIGIVNQTIGSAGTAQMQLFGASASSSISPFISDFTFSNDGSDQFGTKDSNPVVMTNGASSQADFFMNGNRIDMGTGILQGVGSISADATVLDLTNDGNGVAVQNLVVDSTKITMLANGTASDDAAAFGQIPTSFGISGMTGGQVPIAATATTITSSKALAGAGAGIVTGPTIATATHVPVYTSTTGGQVDSGISSGNLVQAVSPSAGIAHFAGSTQTVTSSPVSLTADVSGSLPNANLANPATTVNGQTCTLGSTCTVGTVTTATNLAGGALGSAPYQSATGITTFIASPTTTGHTFIPVWQPSGSPIAPTSADFVTVLSAALSASPNGVTGCLDTTYSTPGLLLGQSTNGTITCQKLFTISGDTLFGLNAAAINFAFHSSTGQIEAKQFTQSGTLANVLTGPLTTAALTATGTTTLGSAGQTTIATSGRVTTSSSFEGDIGDATPADGTFNLITATAANFGSAAQTTINGSGILSAASGSNLHTPTTLVLTNATGLPAASVVAGALANGMTATTQSAADSSTKVATTAYADAAVAAGAALNTHSDYWSIQGVLFATSTVLGPVFQEPIGIGFGQLTARLSGTISCSVAPNVVLLDLGTSATTVFGSATVIDALTTGTTDGVYTVSNTPGSASAQHYYGIGFNSGTCITAPTFDITVVVVP